MTDITESPDLPGTRQRIVVALQQREQTVEATTVEPPLGYYGEPDPPQLGPITDAPGRLTPDDPWTVHPRSPSGSDTEALLNGLIEECGFLMKEVVFRMMCRTEDHATRLAYIGRAMALAETGAKVGDAVARLRSGPVVNEARQRVIVERIERGEGRG